MMGEKDYSGVYGCLLWVVVIAAALILTNYMGCSSEKEIRQAVKDADDFYTSDYDLKLEYEFLMDSASTQIEDCKNLLEEALNTGDFDLVEDALNTLDEIDLDYDNI